MSNLRVQRNQEGYKIPSPWKYCKCGKLVVFHNNPQENEAECVIDWKNNIRVCGKCGFIISDMADRKNTRSNKIKVNSLIPHKK